MRTELSRTVRLCFVPDGSMETHLAKVNAFAAWPPMVGLGVYCEVEVTCIGSVDPVTGYLVNITHIDKAVREGGAPILGKAIASGRRAMIGVVLIEMMREIQKRLDVGVCRVAIRPMPTYQLAIEERDMGAVLMSQQYEFSAAHRLHVPQLTEEQNRRVFGKCNNPAGHGHNYRLEVTVRCPIIGDGQVTPLHQLDELVDRAVVSKFDHKHLNLDMPEFAAVNPSVEHIARTIWGMLEGAVEPLGVTLVEVKVWETGKTVCAYRG